MSAAEIHLRLDAGLQEVRSVRRDSPGPVAMPMSYPFRTGQVRMVTSPDSEKARGSGFLEGCVE